MGSVHGLERAYNVVDAEFWMVSQVEDPCVAVSLWIANCTSSFYSSEIICHVS